MQRVLKFSIILCCLMIFICESHAQVKDPYQRLHGGSYSGVPVKGTPDPLIKRSKISSLAETRLIENK